MSSSSNTASDIPIITDTMVAEYRSDTPSTQTITKDKLIDELVEHIEKQNRVIKELKVELKRQSHQQSSDIGRKQEISNSGRFEKLSTRFLSKLNGRNQHSTTSKVAPQNDAATRESLKAELAKQIKAELLAELKKETLNAAFLNATPTLKPRQKVKTHNETPSSEKGAPPKQEAAKVTQIQSPAVKPSSKVNVKPAPTAATTAQATKPAAPAKPKTSPQPAVQPAVAPPKREHWPFKFDAELEKDEPDNDTAADNEQLFSLTEKLSQQRPTYTATTNAPLALEITRTHCGMIKDQQHLTLGNSYYARVGDRAIKIANNNRKNVCQFYFSSEHFNAAISDASAANFDSTRATPLKGKPGKKLIRQIIPPNKVVYLKAGNDEYRLRSVPITQSPAVNVPAPKKNTQYWRFFRYSLGFHLAIVLLVGIYQWLTYQAPQAQEEQRFAQVELPTPPTPEPKPTPAPTKPIEPTPEPKVVKEAVKITKKPTSPAPKPKNAGGGSKEGGNIKKRDVKQSGLLAALGTKRGKQPGSKQALATISSLDAVQSPSANAATLKVGGLAAKVQGARIEVATGELIDTRGSTAVLRSGGAEGDGRVAALESGITGNREVRGKVSATLNRKVKIQGGLSRDQVKRVIDAHMDEVVYCYEKTLLNTPDLAGKAVFEWKVLMSGRVGEVNIKSSNLRSNQIHSCISNAIKSWQFPQPSGTAVFVSFPFIFDSVEF
ncbi:hypothetical protein P886_1314 [Alteromonadaceae bacterium 2753L.S.0a.02]|nr:hypothetical protein P886_1314 [Alteromonadaceae bacterium 2753L.S.0a.02]